MLHELFDDAASRLTNIVANLYPMYFADVEVEERESAHVHREYAGKRGDGFHVWTLPLGQSDVK